VGMKQANDKKTRMLTSGMSLYTMRHHDGAPVGPEKRGVMTDSSGDKIGKNKIS
jgi:hypothetical protein